MGQAFPQAAQLPHYRHHELHKMESDEPPVVTEITNPSRFIRAKVKAKLGQPFKCRTVLYATASGNGRSTAHTTLFLHPGVRLSPFATLEIMTALQKGDIKFRWVKEVIAAENCN